MELFDVTEEEICPDNALIMNNDIKDYDKL